MVNFAHFNNNPGEKKELQLTPLIDMVFLLLIFFLLTSYYTKPTLPVVLPEAESAQFYKESDIVIVVKKEGTLVLGKKRLSRDELAGLLPVLLESSPEKAIHIQADESIHFGFIIQLMDTAYLAGAEDVFFVVDKKSKGSDQ
jgi:biopolymer transport protein ExbD